MHQLAFISLTGSDGKAFAVCAADVAGVKSVTDGSVITLRSGQELPTQSTVAQVVTAIDTLWTEYLTALGDPA